MDHAASRPGAPADGAPAALTSAQRSLTLLGVLLGMFLAALDQTIVSTAGPRIIEDLHISPTLYDWLSASYNLASTLLVPIWGKLSDVKGRRPILLVGIAIFLLGSLGCALAPEFLTLVGFRAVQGAGAAALFTSAFAVIADLFPPAVRGKYAGILAAMWGISGVIGPVLGGVITDALSWHWVFLVNLPLGALAIVFIALQMPRLGGGLPGRIDLRGVLALASAVVPLLLALTLGRSSVAEGALPTASRWGDPIVLALFAAASAGLALFIRSQARAEHPIIDLAFFREPVFRWGTLATGLVGMAFFASILFAPLFMQEVRGASPTDAGLVLMPLTLGIVSGNILSGQLASRLGRYKGLLVGSVAVVCAANAWLAFTLDSAITAGEMKVKLALLGLTLGPSLPLFTLAIQNGMPARAVGTVTASVTFFRQMGTTIGIAISGAVFGAVLTSSAGASPAEAMTRALAAVFWVGAGITFLALLVTLRVPGHELRKHH
ncbi:MAG: MDR family MFS transporter [Kofleriaceae bacterium]